MAQTPIKFYRNSSFEGTPEVGTVWFNTTERSINICTATSPVAWEKYSGILSLSYDGTTLTWQESGSTTPKSINLGNQFATLQDYANLGGVVANVSQGLTTTANDLNTAKTSLATLHTDLSTLSIASGKVLSALTKEASGNLKQNVVDITTLFNISLSENKRELIIKSADGTTTKSVDLDDLVVNKYFSGVRYDADANDIVFTWTEEGQEQTLAVPLDDLVDVYTSGNGLSLNSNTFAVKADTTTTEAKKVKFSFGADGTLQGTVVSVPSNAELTTAINDAVSAAVSQSIVLVNAGVSSAVATAQVYTDTKISAALAWTKFGS